MHYLILVEYFALILVRQCKRKLRLGHESYIENQGMDISSQLRSWMSALVTGGKIDNQQTYETLKMMLEI